MWVRSADYRPGDRQVHLRLTAVPLFAGLLEENVPLSARMGASSPALESGSNPPPAKANTPKTAEDASSESSPFLKAILANWWIIIAVAMIGPIVILLRSRLRKNQAENS